ncbi:MAG TPA: alpha/beta hydrolase [Anaerolineales bacterium]
MENPDQLTLSTIVEGEVGHPALLVHDLNASLNDWEALIPLLVNSGHVAYACDLFGHGQSCFPEDPGQYYAQLHLTALRRWIDGLALVRAPILIGHGFGAYLCLRYALGHPYRVFKLVLINPLLSPEQIASSVRVLQRPLLMKIASRWAPEWTNRQLLGIHSKMDPVLVERVAAEALRASPFNQRILPGVVDLTDGIASLPTRSLFLLGMDDPLLDMSQIPELVEDLVDVTCTRLPGVGHRPHLEAPEETNRAIINFLLGI